MRRVLFAQAYKKGVNARRTTADKLTSAQLLFIRPAPGQEEFTMTTMSLSFTVATTYAPQTAARPATEAVRKTVPAPTDDSHCDEKRPVARQNRLEQAMMAALRELGFGSTAAATPATSAAATTTTPTATTATAAAPTATPTAATAAASTPTTAGDSGSVESAVHQFAHALFQALRQNGSGDKKTSDDDSGRAEGHHRHHHRHHEGRGYGDMSQRLEALSQTVGAPAAAAPTTSVATPAATTVTPAATPAKNPLLDAFTQLFNTLKPQANTGASATPTPATDMAEKLRQFLHTLAQAMAPDAMGSVQQAQVGGLVNVTA